VHLKHLVKVVGVLAHLSNQIPRLLDAERSLAAPGRFAQTVLFPEFLNIVGLHADPPIDVTLLLGERSGRNLLAVVVALELVLFLEFSLQNSLLPDLQKLRHVLGFLLVGKQVLIL